MGGAYIVLAAMAVLGLALGWRLTPEPSARDTTDGLARLLQLGIALTGLLVLTALLVPWFTSLDQISCTPETQRAGQCIIGLHDRGLVGVSIFVCLIAAAFAFVLRKGVLDFPALPPSVELLEAGVDHLDTIVPTRQPAQVEPSSTGSDLRADTAADTPAPASPSNGSESEAPSSDATASAPAPEAEAEAKAPSDGPEDGASDAQQAPHRRLEGPVFRAFIDDDAASLELAIHTAAARLRSERVAVVFSRGASKAANVAVLELAEAFDAHRYVLEGSAAATEGIPREDAPDPTAVDEIAGPDARHAGELALDLAGSFIQTVFLLDTRVAFPEFVLGKLTELQSVCIAHSHDDVSGACQVVLPGTNPGEREGELIDSDGGTNSRRTREWLVGQIVAALSTLEASDDDTAEGESPEAESATAESATAESATAESATAESATAESAETEAPGEAT